MISSIFLAGSILTLLVVLPTQFIYASNSPTGSPFCDEVESKSDCYDRNDNPEEYCIKYGDNDKEFCELIDICDTDGSIKPEDEYCKGEN